MRSRRCGREMDGVRSENKHTRVHACVSDIRNGSTARPDNLVNTKETAGLAFEGMDGLFDGGNTCLSIGFLLLLESDNLWFGVLNETFIAQFGHNATQEALLVRQIRLQLFDFFVYVDKLVHRNSELGGAD